MSRIRYNKSGYYQYNDDNEDDDYAQDDDMIRLLIIILIRMKRRRRIMIRKYGYFKCTKCRRIWESSQVYAPDVDYDEEKATFGQKCKRCKRVNFPYRIEPLICSMCSEIDCVCSQEDIEDRHIDQRKPHLSHLCMKCKAGLLCTNDRRGHCEC